MLRLIRDIVFALLSAGWVYPLLAGIISVCNSLMFLENNEQRQLYPNGPPFSYAELAKVFFVIAAIWIGVVIAFWSFIAARHLFSCRTGKPARLTEEWNGLNA